MRNQFTFYKSFDDVYQDLTDKQKIKYMDTMMDIQFLRIKVDDVFFEDAILNIVWKSQKHSIKTSIKGYLDSQKNDKIKNPYLGIYDPLYNPSEGVAKQEQVKEQEEEQEEDNMLENEFQGVWSDYTLSFIKKQGRTGGSKKKALTNFVKVRKKFSLEQIVSVVNSHKQMKIGHKDLERILREDFISEQLVDEKPTTLVPSDLVGKKFIVDEVKIEFTQEGYNKIDHDWLVTNEANVKEMIRLVRSA